MERDQSNDTIETGAEPADLTEGDQDWSHLSSDLPTGPRFDVDDGAPITLVADRLRGDLRDEILKRLKAMPKPWTVMSEFEQQEMISGVDRVCADLVGQAVRMVSANGVEYLEGVLIKAETKDATIKTQVNFRRSDPMRHKLNDRAGAPVIVILCDDAEFQGERAPARPDPDEPKLPMGDGGNVAPFRSREDGATL